MRMGENHAVHRISCDSGVGPAIAGFGSAALTFASTHARRVASCSRCSCSAANSSLCESGLAGRAPQKEAFWGSPKRFAESGKYYPRRGDLCTGQFSAWGNPPLFYSAPRHKLAGASSERVSLTSPASTGGAMFPPTSHYLTRDTLSHCAAGCLHEGSTRYAAVEPRVESGLGKPGTNLCHYAGDDTKMAGKRPSYYTEKRIGRAGMSICKSTVDEAWSDPAFLTEQKRVCGENWNMCFQQPPVAPQRAALAAGWRGERAGLRRRVPEASASSDGLPTSAPSAVPFPSSLSPATQAHHAWLLSRGSNERPSRACRDAERLSGDSRWVLMPQLRGSLCAATASR
jgi:hypothetical protein